MKEKKKRQGDTIQNGTENDTCERVEYKRTSWCLFLSHFPFILTKKAIEDFLCVSFYHQTIHV